MKPRQAKIESICRSGDESRSSVRWEGSIFAEQHLGVHFSLWLDILPALFVAGHINRLCL